MNGLNHSYAPFLTAWCEAEEFSFFPTLLCLCVCFLSFDTDSQSEREHISLNGAGFLLKPPDFVSHLSSSVTGIYWDSFCCWF